MLGAARHKKGYVIRFSRCSERTSAGVSINKSIFLQVFIQGADNVRDKWNNVTTL
jgi:hypothetical protein